MTARYFRFHDSWRNRRYYRPVAYWMLPPGETTMIAVFPNLDTAQTKRMPGPNMVELTAAAAKGVREWLYKEANR